MKILVTGVAGFIGFHLCNRLINLNHTVYGIDDINEYYDIRLKTDRLVELGFNEKSTLIFNKTCLSSKHKNLFFKRISINNFAALDRLFKKEKIEVVCNLAAQAGVRYSIENPTLYMNSNVIGFFNILECCKKYKIKHLVYASSSSVYGLNKEIPYKTSQKVDKPVSLYAATKLSNELMAHTYSHLFKIPTTGLRFFTVYGPWGRPDMAMFLFVDAIINNREIKVYNKGEMRRDFTYIDDIITGLVRIIENKKSNRVLEKNPYKIYNIGNNDSIKLIKFIKIIEAELGLKANKTMLPIQPGDVKNTLANTDELFNDYGYSPNTPIKMGVKRFVEWYKNYYQLN